MGTVGLSHEPAPQGLVNLGFGRVEFSAHGGRTRITLYRSKKGQPTAHFVAASGNIAAIRFPGYQPGPELAIFDTGRGRIGATRSISPRSLDDPDSGVSKLTRVAPRAIGLAGHLAGVPGVGSVLASALPHAVETARRRRGDAADEAVRCADFDVDLAAGTACFFRIGRRDREFDPLPWPEVSRPEQEQHVLSMLDVVSGDVMHAHAAFEQNRPGVRSSLTEWLVASSLSRLRARSLEAFLSDHAWPMGLRLLGFDDGPDQYVQLVAFGRAP